MHTCKALFRVVFTFLGLGAIAPVGVYAPQGAQALSSVKTPLGVHGDFMVLLNHTPLMDYRVLLDQKVL